MLAKLVNKDDVQICSFAFWVAETKRLKIFVEHLTMGTCSHQHGLGLRLVVWLIKSNIGFIASSRMLYKVNIK